MDNIARETGFLRWETVISRSVKALFGTQPGPSPRHINGEPCTAHAAKLLVQAVDLAHIFSPVLWFS